MKEYSPRDVFRSASIPEYTYVNRINDNGETYEEELRFALEQFGKIVFITGPTKSGKTVLCKKVIPEKYAIIINGSYIQSVESFWSNIAQQIKLPQEVQMTKTINANNKIEAGLRTGIVNVTLGTGRGAIDTVTEKTILTHTEIIRYLINNDISLIIDDFHLINDDVQLYLSRVLKAEAFNGLRAIILTLPHRANDAIRLNPDLIGRVAMIQIAPWTNDELRQIAERGFALLKLDISENEIDKIVVESAASPQLTQELCLSVSVSKKRGLMPLLPRSFKQVAQQYQGYLESLVYVLQGPRTGRNRRKQYCLRDGTVTDIYRLIFLAISSDPPNAMFTKDELHFRINKLLLTSEAGPTTSSIASAIVKIEELIREKIPKLETLAWKNSRLYITDPFLLFFLRWTQDWKATIID